MLLVKTLSISVAVLLYTRVGLSIVGIKLKFCKEGRKFCALEEIYVNITHYANWFIKLT